VPESDREREREPQRGADRTRAPSEQVSTKEVQQNADRCGEQQRNDPVQKRYLLDVGAVGSDHLRRQAPFVGAGPRTGIERDCHVREELGGDCA
jgi:hypothetical protein